MATMLDDYQHMDIRGADVKNGLKLVFGDSAVSPLIIESPICPTTPVFLDLVGMGCLTMWQIGRKVKDYNKRWADVPYSEKRDVVAALRTATKTAKYAALATKILVWLA